MMERSGHLRPIRRDIGYSDQTRPLVVNCCGCQHFDTVDSFRGRPGGRLDYQLIYLLDGCGTFLLDGKQRTVRAGELVLYRPGEPQVYSYFHKDAPLVYWIHFTGTEAEALLRTYDIRTGYIGCSTALKSIFEEILLELTLKKRNFEDVVCFSFRRLLAMMDRVRSEKENQPGHRMPIDELIVELNLRYQRDWTIASMAKFCMVSESCFAHAFKKYMQITPMQYLTGIRISVAKDLLTDSTLPIADVASAVGYDNPLYFSRVFKSAEGISPKQYRMQMEKEL